jgi:hypothetical protein
MRQHGNRGYKRNRSKENGIVCGSLLEWLNISRESINRNGLYTEEITFLGAKSEDEEYLDFT